MSERMTKKNLIKTYDRGGEPAGVFSRVDAEEKGLIIATVVIALFDKQGYVWLSLRSHGKNTHPGMWDITVSGCVDEADSSNLEAARREVAEETGIDVELTSVGKIELQFFENGKDIVRMPEVFYGVTDSHPKIIDGEVDGFAKYPMPTFRQKYIKYPDLIIRGIDKEIEAAYQHLNGESK